MRGRRVLLIDRLRHQHAVHQRYGSRRASEPVVPVMRGLAGGAATPPLRLPDASMSQEGPYRWAMPLGSLSRRNAAAGSGRRPRYRRFPLISSCSRLLALTWGS
jgi:hypothetical protein